MNCSNCGKSLDDDAKVCDRCGAILENTAKLSEKQAKNMFSENINKITEFLDDMTESSDNADMIRTLLLANGKELKGFVVEDELRELLTEVFSEDEIEVLLPTLFNEVDAEGNNVFRYQKVIEPSEIEQDDFVLKYFVRDIIETVKEDMLMKSLRSGKGSLKSLANQELDDLAIIQEILTSIDVDGNKKITRVEFFDYLCGYFDPELADDYANKVFEEYDPDNKGHIPTDLSGTELYDMIAKDKISVDDVLDTMAQSEEVNEANKKVEPTAKVENQKVVEPVISEDSKTVKRSTEPKFEEKAKEAVELVTTKFITSEETNEEPNTSLFGEVYPKVEPKEEELIEKKTPKVEPPIVEPIKEELPIEEPIKEEPIKEEPTIEELPKEEPVIEELPEELPNNDENDLSNESIDKLEEALEDLLDTHKTVSDNIDDEFGKIGRSNIENVFGDLDEELEKGSEGVVSKGQTLEEVKAEVLEEVRKDLGVEEVEEEPDAEEKGGLTMLERLKNELNSIEDLPEDELLDEENISEELITEEPKVEETEVISEDLGEESEEDLGDQSGFDELESTFKEFNLHDEDDEPNIASRVEEQFEKMNFFKGFDDLDDDKVEVKKPPSFYEEPKYDDLDDDLEEDSDSDDILDKSTEDIEDLLNDFLSTDDKALEPTEEVEDFANADNLLGEETFDEPEESFGGLGEETFDEPEESFGGLSEETFDEPEEDFGGLSEETFDEPEEDFGGLGEETFDEPEESFGGLGEETFDEPEEFLDGFDDEFFDESELSSSDTKESKPKTADFDIFGDDTEDGLADFEEEIKKPKKEVDDFTVEKDDYEEVSDDDLEEFLSGGSFFDQDELDGVETDTLKIDLDGPLEAAAKKNKQKQLNEELENFQDQIDQIGAVDDEELNKFLTGEKEFFDDEELEFTLSKVKKDMVAQQVAERNSQNAIEKREKTIGIFKKIFVDVRLEVINMILLIAIIISVASTLFIFYEPRQNLYYSNYSESAVIEYERALRKQMYVVIGSQDITSDVLYEYMAGEISYDAVYNALEYHRNLTASASEFFLNRVYKEASDYTFALHEFSIESARISEEALDAIINNEKAKIPAIIEAYDDLTIKNYHITSKRNEFLGSLGIDYRIDYFDDFYSRQ